MNERLGVAVDEAELVAERDSEADRDGEKVFVADDEEVKEAELDRVELLEMDSEPVAEDDFEVDRESLWERVDV